MHAGESLRGVHKKQVIKPVNDMTINSQVNRSLKQQIHFPPPHFAFSAQRPDHLNKLQIYGRGRNRNILVYGLTGD